MKALTTSIKPCGWPSQFFSPKQSPTGDNRQAAKEGNSVSVKASARSKIKPIKVICDRCQQIAEGIRGEQFTSGFYDMTKWEEYRRENEQHVCHSCMFADPKYLERYGSCF